MTEFTFIVDTREKDPKVRDYALKKYANSKLEGLRAGDFACLKQQKYLVGVERKTLINFVSAVSDKSIFSQVEKLHATYPIVIIMMEGNMSTLRGTLKRLHLKFNENAFWGTLASIVVRDNFQIFWSPDQHTTVNMSYMICAKIAEGKYHTIRRWRPKGKNSPNNLLEMVPGITTKLAKMLIQKYKSIVKIGEQTQKELCSNKGVGPALAKRIKKYLAGK